jgi:hypothetical protein
VNDRYDRSDEVYRLRRKMGDAFDAWDNVWEYDEKSYPRAVMIGMPQWDDGEDHSDGFTAAIEVDTLKRGTISVRVQHTLFHYKGTVQLAPGLHGGTEPKMLGPHMVLRASERGDLITALRIRYEPPEQDDEAV